MKTEVELCGTLFTRDDFKDISGCLKSESHNDHHICKTKEGILIAWEDDYKCDCGCWDDYESGDSEVCMIYWEVKKV